MAQRYVKFGPVYRRFRSIQTRLICGCSMEALPADAFQMMLFATTTLHERAGANPRFPQLQQMALREAVEASGRPFAVCVLELEDFPETVWDAFDRLCKGKSNKTHTYGPVAGTLKMLRECGTASWLNALRTMSPEDAWTRLDGLKGIGPKLSSFILREFQAFFGVWPAPEPSTWYCFMPVDRWVLRVGKLIWPGDDWPDVPPDGVNKYQEIAQRMASHLPTVEEAMHFDMGAWFLNAMRSEILACHGQVFIGNWEDDTLHLIAQQLDADRVARALTGEILF